MWDAIARNDKNNSSSSAMVPSSPSAPSVIPTTEGKEAKKRGKLAIVLIPIVPHCRLVLDTLSLPSRSRGEEERNVREAWGWRWRWEGWGGEQLLLPRRLCRLADRGNPNPFYGHGLQFDPARPSLGPDLNGAAKW